MGGKSEKGVHVSVETQMELKLPLMGKSLSLEPLPGQDPSRRFGVVWDACRQPDNGLGYVVEFQDARTFRILAWIGRGGTVVECDRPISFVSPGVPAIEALHATSPQDHPSGEHATGGLVSARRHGSDELADVVAYRDAFPNQAYFTPLADKGGEGIRTEEELAAAVGPYSDKKLAWRVLLAVSYLAFFLFPRMGVQRGQATGTISDVLGAFTDQPLPDAIDSLIFRVMAAGDDPEDEVSGFERYAARMLQQAGAAGLRAIAARRRIGVARLSTTHLFWMRFGDDLPPDERATLFSVEACLNRLALVERSLRERGESTSLADCREGLCALEDQRALARIADGARALVDEGEDANPYCVYIPAAPQRGGEWDVRTRFIRACETVPVPFRLEYRFDCHAEGGVLHAVFGLPSVAAFPESRWNAAASRWESRGDDAPAQAACYSLRLAAVVAACGFGTGIGMRQVLVEGREGGIAGTPLLSLRFERMSFLNRTLARIDLGTVAHVADRGICTAADVQALLGLLAPFEARLSFDPAGGLQPIEPLAADIPESRMPLSADRRYLPAELAHLLHADRVCDLDIEGQNDLRQLDAVQTAIEDAQDSPLLAMARLEEMAANNPVAGLEQPDDVVAAAEAALRGEDGLSGRLARPGYEIQDEEGETRPVRIAYFPTIFSRCLVDIAAEREDEAFEALPDHAYLARSALAKLYLADGDEQAAFARVAECVALAPTSEGALLEAAQLHLAARHFEEAAVLLRRALAVCVRQPVANTLYAHLAGAYWGMGKTREALACFMMARGTVRGEGNLDEVIGQLMAQLGLEGPPSAEEARALLHAQGIPDAPNEEVRRILMTAAVGFTDARMFELAWPIVGVIGMDVGNDVIAFLGEMLHSGIPDSPAS